MNKLITSSGQVILEGSVVTSTAFPSCKFVLHFGWYTCLGQQSMGWYLSEIPSQAKQPVSDAIADTLVVVSDNGHGCCPPPCPPPFPPFPPDTVPFTQALKDQLEGAFVSVDTLAERDALTRPLTPTGKIVRVNDADGEGVKYYEWNQATAKWSEFSFPGSGDLDDYLKKDEAEDTYLSKEEAEEDYLTKEEADEKYESKHPPAVQSVSPENYLYYMEYSDLDYEFASEYLKNRYNPVIDGGCASVRNGNFFGRNYDWYYDETASFVIKCIGVKGRHNSIGVCGSLDALTKSVVDSGQDSEAYKILPFVMLDGINDAGVTCNVNLLPVQDHGATTGSNPGGNDLLMMMIVRYVLDYADSAEHAVQLLGDANVISPQSDALTAQFHWLIADAEKSFIVEFLGNEMSVIEEFVDEKPIMTNFFLTGFDGNTATAFYKTEEYDPETTTLPLHPEGVERFDILREGINAAVDCESMINLMSSVKYTKTYDRAQSPFWFSEFVGPFRDTDLNRDSVAADFSEIVDIAIGYYEEYERNKKAWQTVHCSVYDIENRMVTIVPQESGKQFKFSLSAPGSSDGSYLTKEEAADVYLSKEDAEDTYLSQESAEDTYLSKEDAEDTYLSQEDAEDTYLTKQDAEEDYVPKSEIPEDEELLHTFMEEDLVQPLVNEEDIIFVNEDGKIFLY